MAAMLGGATAQQGGGAAGGGAADPAAALAALLSGGPPAQQGGVAAASGTEADPMAALAALLGPRARCIGEGVEGTVVQDDRDETRFKVQGPQGEFSWFRETELARVDGARADGSTRPAVGDKVVLQDVPGSGGGAAGAEECKVQ